MSQTPVGKRPPKVVAGEKMSAAQKMARVPVKFEATPRQAQLRKPPWIRARLPGTQRVIDLKRTLRSQGLVTVCEEASCPNLGECFEAGTATFMIMGDICTRRCPFCDVAHGRPLPLDDDEPARLADTVAQMGLVYVVITSVDRDDLKDGGAGHFVACIEAIRQRTDKIKIEILTPDFRAREATALEILAASPPDVFNHNIETVPALYDVARPGATYQGSLKLLEDFAERCPQVPTKSGLMLGLGETREQVEQTLADLRDHDVAMLTLGQYLQPTLHHLPVKRYWHPEEFAELKTLALNMGFASVASGPMVRSSYHADLQARTLS